MGEITPTLCYDGKRHYWEWQVYFDGGQPNGELKWCPKCGSVTKWYHGKRVKRNGEYYIKIPEITKDHKSICHKLKCLTYEIETTK